MAKTTDRQIVDGVTYMIKDAQAREDIEGLNEDIEGLNEDIEGLNEDTAELHEEIHDISCNVQEIDYQRTMPLVFEWEEGDINPSDGKDKVDDRFVRTQYLPADMFRGRKITLTGECIVYSAVYRYYGKSISFVNSSTYNTSKLISVHRRGIYVRLSVKKEHKDLFSIDTFDEAPAVWKRYPIDAMQLKDIVSNDVYYRDFVQVKTTNTVIHKLFYTLNIDATSASGYTFKCEKCYGYKANSFLEAIQFDSQGNELSSHLSPNAEDPLTLTVNENADRIEFYLRPAYGTALDFGFADFYGLRIYPTESGEGKLLEGETNELVYKSSQSGGFTVPPYYNTSDYLKNKVALINRLYNYCSSNGDAFIVIADEHWEHPQKNTQNSPALINYIYQNTDVQRLFSLGDTADTGSKDYADKLRRAFPRKIYHVAGNHDYMYGTAQRENELYAMWDAYNDDQVGNNGRHYYYVDNKQQKIRYVILNAFAPSGSTEVEAAQRGYEEAQITWMTNVAFNVEIGWSIIIFTHGLWTFDVETGTNMYISTNGNYLNMINAIDSYDGAGEIVGIFVGHEHLDRMAKTNTLGIPVFYQETDANRITQVYKDDDRNPGTIAEQAFDVAILDKEHRTWHLVRIGLKAHDGFVSQVPVTTGQTVATTWGDEVEERTMTY